MSKKRDELSDRAKKFGLELENVGWDGWALYIPSLDIIRNGYKDRAGYILKNLDQVEVFLDNLENDRRGMMMRLLAIDNL